MIKNYKTVTSVTVLFT